MLFCGWSRPAVSTLFPFISKILPFLQNYFIISFYLVLFYFILFYLFSRSFHIIPHMELRPWKAILKRQRIWCSSICRSDHEGRRGLQTYLHLLETPKWLMSVNKHLKKISQLKSIDKVNGDEQGERRRYQSGPSGYLKE